MNTARSLIAAALLGLAGYGCGGDQPTDPGPPPPPPPPGGPASVALNGGNGQQAAAGEAVAVAPSVIVRNAAGDPVAGTTVTFSVTAGGGSLTGASPTTNSAGIAAVSSWKLGNSGEQKLSARVGSLSPVEFTATVTPGTGSFAGTLGAGGGTIQINDPDHEYHGLKLTAPSGMYPTTTTWQLRTGTLSPKFSAPAGFSVMGPPLVVETSAPRGSKLMTLELPVNADEDDLVFLALHDPVSGESELLTVVDRKAGAVVVITSHLRGNLLPGASAGTILSSAAVDLPSQVIPMMLQQTGPVQTSLNRWPITDHGSHSDPDGMGMGIAVLQTLASSGVAPNLAVLVKELSMPGFYAEAGPLAAAKSAHGIISPGITQAFGDIAAATQGLTIGKRDRLVVENMLAMMRFLNKPSTVAFAYEGVAKVGAATVTAASVEELTLIHPARKEPTQVRLNLGGFGSFTLPLVATDAPHPVTEVVPIASTTVNFEPLKSVMADLARLGQAINLEQRETVNRELATKAGLPPMNLRYRGGPDDEWHQMVAQDLYMVVRKQQAEVDLIQNETMVALRGEGTELVRTTGEPVSVLEDLDLKSVSPGTVVPRILTAIKEGSDAVTRQISVVTTQMAFDPFEISPDDIELTPEDLKVDLTVSVKVPPAGGYVVEWKWGDGESTEQAGVTTASHTYQEVGEYTVVARLLTSGDRRELAVDTVRIGGSGDVWTGYVTATSTTITPGFQRVLYTSATGLQYVRESQDGASTFYRLVGGQLTVYNDVPCAGFTSPVLQVDLGAQVDNPYQWLQVTTEDPFAPEGTTPGSGIWFMAYGSAQGLEIRNKSCPTTQNPDPEEYTVAHGATYLRTYPEGGGYRPGSDPAVIEGTFTRQDANRIETWTWRFERGPSE